ncbi:Pantothenate kinase [Streptococcus gordonii]|uniref:Pantothenate kinase n=1 Tax=Streptococcus gordonii TaxID=1302 RepID=A0A139N9W8_STRGN|nr:Pantothenate kinase [Streptococcus gordonii]
MTNEFLHFDRISRERWQQLHRKTTPPLTEEELNSIKSFNDEISLQDVMDIYLPLTNLIQIYKRAKEDLAFSKGIFLQKTLKNSLLLLAFLVV